ncbi:hypothetical protein GYH30_026050 [Glycine max]|nr:hypothetical protein GYH30_026050 [Glycine max]
MFLAFMKDWDVKQMVTRLSNVVLDCVMLYIHDSKDRDIVSQVKATVPAPRVAKAEGKATGSDVQPNTGGLGRFHHTLG